MSALKKFELADMDATREARWQELRMQVEGLLPQGQLLTAEQIAEKFRYVFEKAALNFKRRCR